MASSKPFQFNSKIGDYPAVNIVRKDPGLAAMVSKLTTPRVDTQQRDDQGNRKNTVSNTSVFKSVLAKRAKRNADSASILKLLPDIELSAQILVSSILSPKDMTTVELIYLGPKHLFSPELSASLLNRLKEHFEDVYKIKALLPEMLRDTLFEKGSYPVAVIPENAIDDFINGHQRVTMESMREFVQSDGTIKNVGVLGNYTSAKREIAHRGVTMESFYHNPGAAEILKIDNQVHYKDGVSAEYKDYCAEEFLSVTDNAMVLKIPKLNARVKSQAIKKQYSAHGMGVALEAATRELSDQAIERLIYRNREQPHGLMASIKKQHELPRRSVGNPLIMKLPTESVIPVHVPGNVKQHIGYFVLLDQEGNPIDVPDGDQYYSGLSSGLSGAGSSLASNLIRKVETNMGTGSNSFNPGESSHLDQAAAIYADMVERDLISRIKHGTYSSSFSLAKNEEVYRIMLARVLSKKYTQILYIPIEYVTYIAFKYGDDGIGRSLMDDTAMINTLRTVMLFTDVMASVKNSIGRTKVSVTLPENDPNPMRAMEIAQDEIVRSRMLAIPLGVSNPADITEFIQRSGYEWEFTGHKGIPEVKFDFQQTQTSYTKADTDLQEQLKKSSIMAFGLSPETVENGFSPDFATTALANNILLGKRVIMHQDSFTPQVSDHMRKVAANSEQLVQDLKKIITEKAKGIRIELDERNQANGVELTDELKQRLLINKALHDFMQGFYVELPKPASVTLENQVSELKTYSDALDVALDAYISTEFFTTDIVGEISNQAGTIKALIKAHFIRKWLTDKGVLPELAELTAIGEDGEPQLDFLKTCTEHVQALVRSGVTALATMQPFKQAGDKDLEKMGASSEGGDDTSSSSDDSSSDGGGDFGGDFGGGDMGGMDDMGGDDLSAPGGDAAPVDESEPAPEEEPDTSEEEDDQAAKEQTEKDQAEKDKADEEQAKKDKEAADKAEKEAAAKE